MKYKKNLIVLGLSIILAFSVGYVMPGDRYFEIAKNLDVFGTFFWELNRVHADEPNPTRLMRTGIEAIVGSLDPYTNFYGEGEIEDAKFFQAGQYSGIGAEIIQFEGDFFIGELYKDGPAVQANIKVGDEVVEIDGESISDKSLKEVNNVLNGESGSKVILTIRGFHRDSIRNLEVSREQRQSKNVPYHGMIDKKIGYIKLTGFEDKAGEEVYEAMKNLKRDHADIKGVILDLRANPGGRVDESVQVSNVFLPKGEKIVEMRGRTPESQRSFYTREEPVAPDLPLVVLVNSSSASASEIVAGSIQDLDRGIIIGRRSFGKGLVQNVRPLSYNTQLKITIAKYYTPSGRCIQAIDYSARNPDGSVGIIPDSLKSSFETKSGRTVYDGGGIEPDIEVEKPAFHSIVKALTKQGLIFEFASTYSMLQDSLVPPREFILSDSLYEAFVNFVQKKDFTFETNTDAMLHKWQKEIKDSVNQEEIKTALLELDDKISELKKEDIDAHKGLIAQLLKEEILKHYYFRDGILEASFEDDPDILSSLEILNAPSKYKGMLNKN